MRVAIALLLLCSVAYAQKPPKTAGMKQVAGRTPSSAFVPDEQLPPKQPSALMLGGGAYQPHRPLTDKEYKEQKKRYAEFQVHKRAQSRAGQRQSGQSVHDGFIESAQDAVRRYRGG